MGQMISHVRHHIGRAPAQARRETHSHEAKYPAAADRSVCAPAILDTYETPAFAHMPSAPRPIPNSAPRVRDDSSCSSRSTFRSSYNEAHEGRSHGAQQARPNSREASPRLRMGRLADMRMTVATLTPGAPSQRSRR